MVERFMRTLKDMVSKYIDAQGLNWDEGIRSYAMAYNSSVHETTGYTPFYMIHGFEPRLPLDVIYGVYDTPIPIQTFLNKRLESMRQAFAQVKKTATEAASRMAVRHDSRVRFTAHPAGSKVWVPGSIGLPTTTFPGLLSSANIPKFEFWFVLFAPATHMPITRISTFF